MRDFKKLLIWQQGRIIVDKIYNLIPILPDDEKLETKTEQKMLAKFIDKVGS